MSSAKMMPKVSEANLPYPPTLPGEPPCLQTLFRAGTTMLRVQLVGEFETRGIATERFGFIEQDDAGIWWTPNGDGVAWFKDPDGNTLSLTQFAKTSTGGPS
jgi:hypothetical protein